MFKEIEFTGNVRLRKNEATFKKLGSGYVLVLPKCVKKNLPAGLTILFDDESGSIAIKEGGLFTINANGHISCAGLRGMVKDGAKFTMEDSGDFLVLLKPV